MSEQFDDLDPKFWKINTWKTRIFVKIFFITDIIFLSSSIIASILIAFYRPFLIFIFTIFNTCLLILTLYGFLVLRGSENRIEIIYIFNYYRLAFFFLIFGFNTFELVYFLVDTKGFLLSKMFLCPFLYFITCMLYEVLAMALSIILICLCKPVKDLYKFQQSEEEQIPTEAGNPLPTTEANELVASNQFVNEF